METMDAVMKYAAGYGFPAVCCYMMFRYLEKERDTHREELASVTKALNENTKILEQLKSIIERVVIK